MLLNPFFDALNGFCCGEWCVFLSWINLIIMHGDFYEICIRIPLMM